MLLVYLRFKLKTYYVSTSIFLFTSKFYVNISMFYGINAERFVFNTKLN